MWTTTSASDLKNAFDATIELAYGAGRRGELENLANLFADTATAGYQQALQQGLDSQSEAYVDVAWIDKRPIATITEADVGAELGDMLIVVHEFDPDGLKVSRACLLEVKQSPSIAVPAVPVNSDQSTTNQFKILSTWPPLYGLKATGSNKTYLLENINTRPCYGDGGALAQAWYVAVKPPSANGVPTSTPWVAAPAISGANFEHTLGEIFSACARGVSLKNSRGRTPIQVGREFQMWEFHFPNNWNSLVNAIIWVAQKYSLPPGLFSGKRRRRYVPGWHFVPAGFLGFGLPSPTLNVTDGIFIFLITLSTFAAVTYSQWWWRGRIRDPLSPIKRGAFPVMTFQIYHSEPIEISRRDE
jgi:hypothetical protein